MNRAEPSGERTVGTRQADDLNEGERENVSLRKRNVGEVWKEAKGSGEGAVVGVSLARPPDEPGLRKSSVGKTLIAGGGIGQEIVRCAELGGGDSRVEIGVSGMKVSEDVQSENQ